MDIRAIDAAEITAAVKKLFMVNRRCVKKMLCFCMKVRALRLRRCFHVIAAVQKSCLLSCLRLMNF